jgi:hypothetical protein
LSFTFVYPVVPVFDFKLLDATEFVSHASTVSSLTFLPTLSEAFESTEPKIDTGGKVRAQRWPMAAGISFNNRFSGPKTVAHAHYVTSIPAAMAARLPVSKTQVR